MGITVASHSSVLDDDVVQKVLEKLGPKLTSPGKATRREAEADPGRGERSKVGMASNHAAERRPDQPRQLPGGGRVTQVRQASAF